MDAYDNMTIEEALTLYDVGFVLEINDGKVVHVLPEEM